MDEYIVKEIKRSYGWMPLEGMKVLDLGACFGAFGHYAVERGAFRVLSVEPEPDNLKQLAANRDALLPAEDKWKWMFMDCAVVPFASKDESIRLYVNSGANKGAHATRPVRGREFIDVATTNLYEIFENFMEPEVLKVDIEGAEYEIFEGIDLPDCIEYITIEMHFGLKAHRPAAAKLHEYFLDQGFKAKKPPKLTGGDWYTLAQYTR
jgi:FkbM family methyltransferase